MVDCGFYYSPPWELALTADSLYESRSDGKKKINVLRCGRKKNTIATGNKLLLNFASIISKPKGTYFEIGVKRSYTRNLPEF